MGRALVEELWRKAAKAGVRELVVAYCSFVIRLRFTCCTPRFIGAGAGLAAVVCESTLTSRSVVGWNLCALRLEMLVLALPVSRSDELILLLVAEEVSESTARRLSCCEACSTLYFFLMALSLFVFS